LGLSFIPFIFIVVGFLSSIFFLKKFSRFFLHATTNVLIFFVTAIAPCLILEFIFGFSSKARDYSVFIIISLVCLLLLYMVIGLILGRGIYVREIEVKFIKIPIFSFVL
jgi:small-conductance mechanosensitive channel